jgi:primosomal protein N' (replication factor Y)
VRVELSAADERTAQQGAEAVAHALTPLLPEGAALLGPAPMFRRRNRYRRQLLVKSADRATAVAAVREAVERTAKGLRSRDVALSVDPDPG